VAAKAKSKSAETKSRRKSSTTSASTESLADSAVTSSSSSALAPRELQQPVFSQPEPTADPTVFRVRHPSDKDVYKEIDKLNAEHKLFPLPFPPPRGGTEPQLTLTEVLGGNKDAVKQIEKRGQMVFHSTGDCGNTKGPATQNEVADKMTADFVEADPKEVPQFMLMLGDVVYDFGEGKYYYDQFYEPYRDYPAPILACAGNHDGMISPEAHATSLAAYLRNFCAEGFVVTPDAGGLSRTAQIQPGVFFTFEAPFVRVLVLYSNTLEDPGVIADNKHVGESQLAFLEAALKRVKAEKYRGALLIADHHPPYTVSRHGWSVKLLAQIDSICEKTGVWPHAFLSGHAHNYQRFTRTRGADGTQIPYVVCGNGGHGLAKLTRHGETALRVPQVIQKAGKSTDEVVLENYDDVNFGYLRIIVNEAQLRIEYHSASDGVNAKAPNDYVTVDLHSRMIGHFTATDLGRPKAGAELRALMKKQKA
jgi:hypothetical protein